MFLFALLLVAIACIVVMAVKLSTRCEHVHNLAQLCGDLRSERDEARSERDRLRKWLATAEADKARIRDKLVKVEAAMRGE